MRAPWGGGSAHIESNADDRRRLLEQFGQPGPLQVLCCRHPGQPRLDMMHSCRSDDCVQGTSRLS